MLRPIVVENMNYILGNSPYNEGSGTHHLQANTRPIRLVLYFYHKEPDQPNDAQIRLSAVQVPKGTPIYQVRNLVRYIENALSEIYGPTKRANFLSVSYDEGISWRLEHQLPITGVSYV